MAIEQSKENISFVELENIFSSFMAEGYSPLGMFYNKQNFNILYNPDNNLKFIVCVYERTMNNTIDITIKKYNSLESVMNDYVMFCDKNKSEG